MLATHALLARNLRNRPYGEIATAMFEGNLLAGCEVAGGAAFACTDFGIHADGFSRILVDDRRADARAPEPGRPADHEPARRHPATAAIHRRGALGGRRHLLHRRPGRLRGEVRSRLGLKIDADLTVGISIPVVAVLVALGLRRVDRLVMHQHS